jgi:hypothetical protein
LRTKNNGLSKVAVGAVAKKAQFVPHCGHLTQENAAKRTNGRFGAAAAQRAESWPMAGLGRLCCSTDAANFDTSNVLKVILYLLRRDLQIFEESKPSEPPHFSSRR